MIKLRDAQGIIIGRYEDETEARLLQDGEEENLKR